MLKVNQDVKRQDYLDYNLRPLVVEVIQKHCPAGIPITDEVVTRHLTNDRGLRIPNAVVQHILRRLAREKVLSKANEQYTLTGSLPFTDLQTRSAEAERTINQIIRDFIRYAKEELGQVFSDDQASTAFASFLQKFGIECLRAYVFNTALPDLRGKKKKRDQYCVSQYVNNIHDTDTNAFNGFMILVKGQMLANALLCPDLDSLSKSFKSLTIYLDTPLILRLLKLEGDASFFAVSNLLKLVHNLGAKTAIFSHTKDEINRVLERCECAIQDPDKHGRILDQCRADGKSGTDIALERNRLDVTLDNIGITIENKPDYVEENFELQISESDLEMYIQDEVTYRENNRAAVRHDIDSIRSIYVLRQGKKATRLEDCGAVFMTTNAALSKAAFSFGRDYERTKDVSTVVTDYSLSNIAWLKAPLGAPDLPMHEVLAYCYAGLSPSNDLWENYLDQVDKLKSDGRITSMDHQMLRVSTQVRGELMGFTCGDVQALQESTPMQIMTAIKAKLTEEKDVQIQYERKQKDEANIERKQLEEKHNVIQARIYWIASRTSKALAILLSFIITMGVIVASFLPKDRYSTLLGETHWFYLGFLPLILVGFLVLILNPIFGLSVKDMYFAIENKLYVKIHSVLFWVLTGEKGG